MGRKLAVDPQEALVAYKLAGSTRQAATHFGSNVTGVMVWRALQKTKEGRQLVRRRARNRAQSRRRMERVE